MTREEAKIEKLYEYVKNKISKIDREIIALEAKRDAYNDIKLELYEYRTESDEVMNKN